MFATSHCIAKRASTIRRIHPAGTALLALPGCPTLTGCGSLSAEILDVPEPAAQNALRQAASSSPGIDLYSIGPNDFAQSLGYPGRPDHPDVVKTMQEITRRIRQGGRTMQLEVMQGAWVSDRLLDAGRRILSS